MKTMKVSKIMTKNVLALRPSDTLHDAIQKFAKKGVSGAPVVNAYGNIVGVVSDADLTRALDVVTPSVKITSSKIFNLLFASLRSKKEGVQLQEELKEAKKIKVRSFMSEPIVMSSDASLMEVIKKMVSDDINRLPIVDSKKRLVGIVARADIIKALSKNFK